MSQPTTKSEPTRGDRETARGDARSLANWSFNRAWRLRQLFGPIARAISAIAPLEGGRRRVLVLGGDARALEAMLERGAASGYDVVAESWTPGEALSYDDGAFDCVVAVDALPLVRPASRAAFVSELCRVARAGIAIAGPFDTEGVAAAERTVEALYAASGAPHAALGRHVEYGLPDLETASAWARAAFPSVATRGLDDLAGWQLAASAAAAGGERDASAADAAAATLLPAIDDAPPARAYRTLLVASSREVSFEDSTTASDETAALATSVAVEAAAHRAALERLVEAVTTEREREREEFRASVSSLAAELHEREAQVEVLERQLHERERMIANHIANIENVERRVALTDLHVENLENERDATSVHVRNLEAERDLLREHVEALRHEAERARSRADALERELGSARAVVEEYRQWAESRGGRALTGYVRMKRRLLGKG
jgi:hypothetical protein